MSKDKKEKSLLDGLDFNIPNHKDIDSLKQLSEADKKALENVGTLTDALEGERSGNFLQMDQSVVNVSRHKELLEILPISKALEKYDWLREKYLWKIITAEKDEFTRAVNEIPQQGYFIHALTGYKGGNLPVQACLYLTKENYVQRVHNIIIAEEGADLNILSGCTSAISAKHGAHLGISEFYIKKDAKISFTMIHSWGEEIIVRPRSAAIVEENGAFTSNYISLKPVKSLQMYPRAICGKNAIARFYSTVAAFPGNTLDLGSAVELNGDGAAAEIVSRTVSHGGTIIARGKLTANAPNVQGHLECQGLMLAAGGVIKAIPELEGNIVDSELSHEAAVGKIAEEKISYLQARGLSRQEATALIVTGFLNLDIKGLPDVLKNKMKEALDTYGKAMF